MSEIEKELIHEIEQLILHAEEDSLDYSVLEHARKLVFRITHPKEYAETFKNVLSDEDCKKIGWVDVEKLANEKYQKQSDNPPYTIITPKDKILGFIEGFKAAQSLNEKKFSEEEIDNSIKVIKVL